MAERWSIDGPRVVEVGSAQEPVRALRVRIVGGRVDVVAHDDEEEATATVEVTSVRGRPLEVTWNGGRLEVAHPDLGWESLLERLVRPGRDDEAQVSIAVPRGTRVELGTVSGEGLVSGVHAPAQVRTVSGSVVVDGVHGEVSARSVSGPVQVRDQHGAFTGESVSGSVSVHALQLPNLVAKSVSGDVDVDLLEAPAQVRLKTVSGDVTLRVPADAGYQLRARSVSGRVVAGGRRLTGGPGTVDGELADGRPDVRVVAVTVSGDVTLLHAAPA